MADTETPDYYEALQVSPRADSHTIERVFRHLAKRFHPDNDETGNSERFALIAEAVRVLLDPETRARYDAKYARVHQRQWQVLDQESAADDVEADRRIRLGILSLLYAARRRDVEEPGLGPYQLEQMLGCPEPHMQFHVWYLKENGWIERLGNGQFAITVSGVDKLVETDLPWRGTDRPLLPSGHVSPRSEDVDGSGGTVEESGGPGSESASPHESDIEQSGRKVAYG